MSTISSLNPIIWYDPSDWSTLFQDSAGTIPVTAVGDPVGLMLDKSVSLTWTPLFSTDFSSTPSGWTMTNATISGGTLNLSPSATVNAPIPTPVIGRRYKVTYTITAITPGTSSIRVFVGTIGGANRTTTGTFTDYLTYTSGAASFYFFTGAAFVSGTLDGMVIEEMIGNHAHQATAINRPTLAQAANGKYFLAFNGTNSRMLTALINLTAANKMTMVAGISKVSDAAAGMITEFSAAADTNNGAFYLQASSAAGANYRVLVRGSAISGAIPDVAAPDTSVIATMATLEATGAFLLRLNTVRHTSSTPAFGAVNFGKYQLFIGHRSGGFLHFNGGLYGLIIRDTDSTTAEIEMMEQYMIARTHATPIPTSRMLTGVGK